jgi:hypothetical protein
VECSIDWAELSLIERREIGRRRNTVAIPRVAYRPPAFSGIGRNIDNSHVAQIVTQQWNGFRPDPCVFQFAHVADEYPLIFKPIASAEVDGQTLHFDSPLAYWSNPRTEQDVASFNGVVLARARSPNIPRPRDHNVALRVTLPRPLSRQEYVGMALP